MKRSTLVLSLLSSLALPASAQEGVSAERLRPSLDRDGILETEWAGIGEHLDHDVALWLDYARNPLVLYDASGQRTASLVKNRLGAELVGALALFEWLELGADLPLTLYQGSGAGLAEAGVQRDALASAGVGDLRIVPKLRLLRAGQQLVDLSVVAALTLPTATPGGSFHGEEQVSVAPQILASRALGDLRFSASVGYRWRQSAQLLDLAVGPELGYSAGVGLRLRDAGSLPMELLASLSGTTAASQPFGQSNQSPLELLLGAQVEVQDGLQAFGGAGVGIIRGAGTPDLRVLGGVRWSPRASDKDGDRILDAEDKCPEQAEDPDAHDDADGCPDPDDDADGILDVDDGCDSEPEDVDTFEDKDGCPDPDNDSDDLVDEHDLCPLVAEDQDGFEDTDGCPEKDNDNDGLEDAADKCPAQAEDKDAFEDDDGCPELDNDKDGIEDKDDKCKDKPEVMNGVDDDDGCPDEGKASVQLTENKIEITDKIYFDTGKATIQSKSNNLLQQIFAILRAHPEITKLRIEGHTDDKGDDKQNMRLSQGRADSVKEFLVKLGITAKRLEAAGLGETKPISSNKTSRGREMNRRVEFVILETDGKPRAQP